MLEVAGTSSRTWGACRPRRALQNAEWYAPGSADFAYWQRVARRPSEGRSLPRDEAGRFSAALPVIME
jgi:hypothetical protein